MRSFPEAAEDHEILLEHYVPEQRQAAAKNTSSEAAKDFPEQLHRVMGNGKGRHLQKPSLLEIKCCVSGKRQFTIKPMEKQIDQYLLAYLLLSCCNKLIIGNYSDSKLYIFLIIHTCSHSFLSRGKLTTGVLSDIVGRTELPVASGSMFSSISASLYTSRGTHEENWEVTKKR